MAARRSSSAAQEFVGRDTSLFDAALAEDHKNAVLAWLIHFGGKTRGFIIILPARGHG
jgi:hypothetical protein